MNRCIAKQMVMIVVEGLWELIQVFLVMGIVLGIPALIVWGIVELIRRHWGQAALENIYLITAGIFIVAIFVALISELYKKARENCLDKNERRW